MMKNAFYFTLKTLSVLKIFKFFSWLFGHVEKLLDEKDKVNLKIYDAKTRELQLQYTFFPVFQEANAIWQ